MGSEQTYDENYQGEPADAGAPVRPAIHTTHHDDDRPAQVRIAELFERMQPHRPILQAVMQRCLERPCAFVELRQMIEGLSEHHRSVYAPEGFCDLLERSGALRKVTAEGEPCGLCVHRHFARRGDAREPVRNLNSGQKTIDICGEL